MLNEALCFHCLLVENILTLQTCCQQKIPIRYFAFYTSKCVFVLFVTIVRISLTFKSLMTTWLFCYVSILLSLLTTCIWINISIKQKNQICAKIHVIYIPQCIQRLVGSCRVTCGQLPEELGRYKWLCRSSTTHGIYWYRIIF